MDNPLFQDLVDLNVNRKVAEKLISEKPLEVIRNQLDWLPRRRAKNRAATLVKAIGKEWPKPDHDGSQI